MKYILTILLFLNLSANATKYYVANAGSNANNGTATGTPWQTATFAAAAALIAGDSLFFNRGDSWNEKFYPSYSGTASSTIYIGAYGNGANPIITGLQSASGWVDSTGNIWMSSIPNSVAYQNTIVVNGSLVAKARYPNYSYLGGYVQDFNRVTLQTTIPFNCTGAELVLSNYVWIWDINKIASQSGNTAGDTLRLQTPLTYNINGVITPRLFIQNSFACLDTLNEWYFDSTRKKLFLESVGSPPSVQFSSIDTLISTHNRSYLTFQNIRFTGGNNITFSADSGSYIIVKNCAIDLSGKNGLVLNRSVKTTLQNSTITNCLNDGIYMRWPSDSTLISTDTIRRIGMYPGMGMSGNAANEGVFAYGKVIKIINSIIDSTGYNGYTWYDGLKDTVYRNFVTNFCLIKADGGGIYTDGSNTAAPQTGSLVRSNIVGNGIGGFGLAVSAIYMDNQSSGVTVDSNTVYNSFSWGITFNGGVSITSRNNLVVSGVGSCFNFTNSIAFSGTIKNNAYYSTARNFAVSYFGNTAPNASIFEDSNYVLRSTGTDSLIQYGQTGGYYTAAAWKSFSNQDLNSIFSFPSSAISTVGTLYYNPTLSDSVITLSGYMVNHKGVIYNNSITLHPFESALLFLCSGLPYILSTRNKYLKVR